MVELRAQRAGRRGVRVRRAVRIALRGTGRVLVRHDPPRPGGRPDRGGPPPRPLVRAGPRLVAHAPGGGQPVSAERPAAPRIDGGRSGASGPPAGWWRSRPSTQGSCRCSIPSTARRRPSGANASGPASSARGSPCASPTPTPRRAPSRQPPCAAPSTARQAGCANSSQPRTSAARPIWPDSPARRSPYAARARGLGRPEMAEWPGPPAPAEPVRLPLPLAPMLLDAVGYQGGARYVALRWWGGGGGDVLWSDGSMTATGWWPAWRLLVREHPLGRAIFAAYDLGDLHEDPAEEAPHWLLCAEGDRKGPVHRSRPAP